MPINNPSIESKVIWKDASARVLADLNRTVASGWTNLDLTASTSAAAKMAMLELIQGVDVLGTGYTHLSVRKNGTTPTMQPRVVMHPTEAAVGDYFFTFVIVGLDTSQIIQYFIGVGTSAWQVDSYIDVLGYIE